MEIKHYEFKYGEYGETLGVQINLRGFDVLRFNNINKDTGFTIDERHKLKLNGFLPPRVKTIENQLQASLDIIEKKVNDIEKFIYIRSLYDRNVVLAHAVIASNITKFLPIIYTPT
ncbi:MAG: NAD-dependent malic enzyme, partial [Desulfobacula sp.]|nr:NAD-dependent malic enzyme [Desulfobacula sp.]